MMFQVRWEDEATDELADIWLSADPANRHLITRASNRIDQKFRSDPLSESESRPNERRVLFVAPLGVLFRIESDAQTVSVLKVWLFRTRR